MHHITHSFLVLHLACYVDIADAQFESFKGTLTRACKQHRNAGIIFCSAHNTITTYDIMWQPDFNSGHSDITLMSVKLTAFFKQQRDTPPTQSYGWVNGKSGLFTLTEVTCKQQTAFTCRFMTTTLIIQCVVWGQVEHTPVHTHRESKSPSTLMTSAE